MNKTMQHLVKPQVPCVVFQPETYHGLQLGINQLVEGIKPTLGSASRTVVSEQSNRNTSPEILDNGALIARRIIEISGRDADMGAMLLRQMLWQLFERTGDGTTTAAILFQSIFDGGLRYIVAGGNAQQLRMYLLNGMHLVLEQIQSIAQPIEGQDNLRKFIQSVTQDQVLIDILTEIFDTLGSYARVDIRSSQSRGHAREYVQGILWSGGVHNKAMILDSPAQKTTFEYSAIFISDMEFEDPNDLLPIIDAASKKYQSLVMVASKVSEKAVGLITYINNQPKPFKLITIKLPEDRLQQHDLLEDLLQTVGGRIFRSVSGDSVASITENDFGRAKKLWANQDYLCIEEANDEIDRSPYLLSLEKQYQLAKDDDQERLRHRIGQLMGASATLYVGGLTEAQINKHKDHLAKIITVIRGAMEKGVVSGGGYALIACRDILHQALATADSLDEVAAYRILLNALISPTSTILENAGHYPGIVLDQIGTSHYMLSEQAELVIDSSPLIYDSVEVVLSSFESAVRTAALALTIDVLVHHRNPEFSATP